MRHFLYPPPIENAFYDNSLRYDLHDDMYFVFGSNLAGRHGAGAAYDALNEHGAILGQGIGFMGKAYAVPTKDYSIKTLPLEEIEKYVKEFVYLTNNENRHNKFFVTALGTGLAGHRHEQIAPMFKGVINCQLPLVWKPYL